MPDEPEVHVDVDVEPAPEPAPESDAGDVAQALAEATTDVITNERVSSLEDRLGQLSEQIGAALAAMSQCAQADHSHEGYVTHEQLAAALAAAAPVQEDTVQVEPPEVPPDVEEPEDRGPAKISGIW